MNSLCILYNALVLSRIEYGLIAYRMSLKTRQKKLELAPNDTLCLITPHSILHPVEVQGRVFGVVFLQKRYSGHPSK